MATIAAEASPSETLIMTATPKLRWYHFGLIGMLVAMTLACVPLMWLVYERHEVGKRAAAIAALRKLGARLDFDSSQPSRPNWLRALLSDQSTGEVVEVLFDRGNVTDADLVHVAGMTKIKRLDIHGSKVTDVGMGQLATLRNLETLDLHGTQVTNAGLTHLTGLRKLKRLYLYDTQITDAGLIHLAGLAQLEHLDLSRTPTTDYGLAHLAGLAELRSLYLYNNHVTDKGISHLAGNQKLDLLYLYGTRVTDEGINELRKALPNVRIKQ
jgi:hypothetical protein